MEPLPFSEVLVELASGSHSLSLARSRSLFPFPPRRHEGSAHKSVSFPSQAPSSKTQTPSILSSDRRQLPNRPPPPPRGVLSFAFQDQFPQSSPPTQPKEERELKKEEEDHGEVSRIVGSRTVRFPVYGDDGSVSTTTTTEYLIEWKDGPQPLLGPSPAAIAADVEAEYETPWWTAARKADTAALSALLADESSARDPDAEDTDGRTALHLAAGLESEECIRMLAAAGADRREADAAARGGRVRAGGGCAGAAGGRGGRRGGGRAGKDGAGAGEGGAGGDAGVGIGEKGWAGGDGGGGGAGEGGGGEEEGVLGGVEGRREGVGEGGVGGRLRGRAGVRGGRRGGETEGSGGGRWEGVLGEVGGY